MKETPRITRIIGPELSDGFRIVGDTPEGIAKLDLYIAKPHEMRGGALDAAVRDIESTLRSAIHRATPNVTIKTTKVVHSKNEDTMGALRIGFIPGIRPGSNEEKALIDGMRTLLKAGYISKDVLESANLQQYEKIIGPPLEDIAAKLLQRDDFRISSIGPYYQIALDLDRAPDRRAETRARLVEELGKAIHALRDALPDAEVEHKDMMVTIRKTPAVESMIKRIPPRAAGLAL